MVLLAAAASAATSVNVCLACHGVRGEPYRDSLTGRPRRIGIDLEVLRQGDHASLDCRGCHRRGFAIFPHDLARAESADCADCHPRREAPEPLPFARFAREFQTSAHGRIAGAAFRCRDCHESHGFRATARLATAAARLAAHNEPCVACHRADARGPLADPVREGLEARHGDLPRTRRHLEATRCLDCHAPVAPQASHALLAGPAAKPGCVTCHRRESRLIRTLYRGIDADGLSDLGFVNGALARDVYVVGATANRWLDALLLALLGGTAAFVGRVVAKGGTGRAATGTAARAPGWVVVWHWASAACIAALLASGALLHWPSLAPPAFALAARLHDASGLVLAALYAAVVPGYLGGRWRLLSPRLRPGEPGRRAWLLGYLRGTPPRRPPGPYNALQRAAYASVLGLVLPALIVTGLSDLVPGLSLPPFLGLAGLTPLALLHWLAAGIVSAFALVHIGLALADPEGAGGLARMVPWGAKNSARRS